MKLDYRIFDLVYSFLHLGGVLITPPLHPPRTLWNLLHLLRDTLGVEESMDPHQKVSLGRSQAKNEKAPKVKLAYF